MKTFINNKSIKDIPTRWNFTYNLLCENDESKDLLRSFMQYNVSDIVFYPQQWNMCTKNVNY